MSEGQQFEVVELLPEGREFLACSCAYPAEWNRIPIPPEERNLQEDLTAMVPLFIGMAAYGAVIFTVAARPAYTDGTVLDWAKFLAQANGLEILNAKAIKLNGLPGVECEAIQPSEAGRLRMRVVFLEDGGRLYNIGNMAPEQVWGSVDALLKACQQSFRLKDVGGTKTPLGVDFDEDRIDHPKPSVEIPRLNPEEDGSDNPHANLNPPASVPPSSPSPAANTPTAATEVALDEVALADDAATLDPEHPTNANLRNNGVGFATPVLMTSAAEKFALVASATLERAFRVPFGWHAIDDTRRTLVFETTRNIQINFDLRAGGESDIPTLFQSIIQDLVSTHGDFQYFEFEVAGFKGLGIKELPIEGERLSQAYLAKPSDHPNKLLVCRITAAGEHINFALNAAEVMLTSIQPLPPPPANAPRNAPPQPPPQDTWQKKDPDWWLKALELERQDKLKEAEKTILAAIDHLGVYSQLAHLYELRGQRFTAANQPQKAREAYEQSCQWMDTMASQATSGGEGAALSAEAKAHRQRLGIA